MAKERHSPWGCLIQGRSSLKYILIYYCIFVISETQSTAIWPPHLVTEIKWADKHTNPIVKWMFNNSCHYFNSKWKKIFKISWWEFPDGDTIHTFECSKMRSLEYNCKWSWWEKKGDVNQRSWWAGYTVFQMGVDNEKSYHLVIMSKDIIGMKCRYRDTWH